MLHERRFAEALAELDEMVASRNLRRPLLPLELHARLMTLPVRVRRIAAEEEQDRGRREAMAEAALTWADRVLSVLPENAEACWYLDYHRLWLVRLECLYARATGLTLRAIPDPAGARAALDLDAKRARPLPASRQPALARRRERGRPRASRTRSRLRAGPWRRQPAVGGRLETPLPPQFGRASPRPQNKGSRSLEFQTAGNLTILAGRTAAHVHAVRGTCSSKLNLRVKSSGTWDLKQRTSPECVERMVVSGKEWSMRKAPLVLAAAATLGLATIAAPAPAQAWRGGFFPGVAGGFIAGGGDRRNRLQRLRLRSRLRIL